MNISGFILDIDNTLLNTAEIHLKAWHFILKKYGINKTDDEIRIHFGKPTRDMSRLFTEYKDDILAEKITTEKTEKFASYIPDIKYIPGVKDALELIHSNKNRICFASASYNYLIRSFIEKFEWNKICSGFVGLDDVTNSKPHPEMILKAIKLLQLPPEECVVIGDSLHDIEAGQRAGTKTIGVCTGENSHQEFMTKNSDLILDSFSNIIKYLPLNL